MGDARHPRDRGDRAPSTRREPCLSEALRPDIFGDPALVEQVGVQLRAGRIIVVPDAIAEIMDHAFERDLPILLP